MATRIEAFQVEVPAGTLQTSPVDTDLSFHEGNIDRLQVMVPPGPSGLAGFAFVHSGQQIIPWATGDFIVADDETITWDTARYPQGSPWVLRAYNEDIYAHTLYIRLSITDEVEEGLSGLLTLQPELTIPPGGTPPDEDEGQTSIMDLVGEDVEVP